MTIINYYTYQIPGSKKFYEPPRLVVRVFNGREYYWNFEKRAWVRLTKRCPYIQ